MTRRGFRSDLRESRRACLDGRRRHGMTGEQIASLEQSLDQAGVRYRSEVYDGARHGYTMADLEQYDEPARERHFRKLRALLNRALS